MLIKQRGFTLIELVLFMVIVSIAVAAVSLQFSKNVQHSAEPLLRQKAVALANEYFDEIVRKKWDELTPDTGGCIATSAATNCAPKWTVKTWQVIGDRIQPTAYNGDIYEATVGGRTDNATEPTWPTGAGSTVNDGTGANIITWTSLGAPSIGADAGEVVRADFDDIDDYNDLPPDTSVSGFTVTITVAHPGSAWNGVPASDVKHIQVSVAIAATGETLNFTMYRVNF